MSGERIVSLGLGILGSVMAMIIRRSHSLTDLIDRIQEIYIHIDLERLRSVW